MTDEFPLDFKTLTPDDKPRKALALPPGHPAAATPDVESPVFDADPGAALDAFVQAAEAEPRVELIRREGLQAELTQKSAVFRFTDKITVEAVDRGNGRSSLCVYSRAQVGYFDMKVNLKRVERWLDATRRRLSIRT